MGKNSFMHELKIIIIKMRVNEILNRYSKEWKRGRKENFWIAKLKNYFFKSRKHEKSCISYFRIDHFLKCAVWCFEVENTFQVDFLVIWKEYITKKIYLWR
jgi:hypothetical protein